MQVVIGLSIAAIGGFLWLLFDVVVPRVRAWLAGKSNVMSAMRRSREVVACLAIARRWATVDRGVSERAYVLAEEILAADQRSHLRTEDE